MGKTKKPGGGGGGLFFNCRRSASDQIQGPDTDTDFL
jgi:hypothetical protein